MFLRLYILPRFLFIFTTYLVTYHIKNSRREGLSNCPCLQKKTEETEFTTEDFVSNIKL